MTMKEFEEKCQYCPMCGASKNTMVIFFDPSPSYSPQCDLKCKCGWTGKYEHLVKEINPNIGSAGDMMRYVKRSELHLQELEDKFPQSNNPEAERGLLNNIKSSLAAARVCYENEETFTGGSHLGWAGHDMGKVGQLIEYNPKEIIQGE